MLPHCRMKALALARQIFCQLMQQWGTAWTRFPGPVRRSASQRLSDDLGWWCRSAEEMSNRGRSLAKLRARHLAFMEKTTASFRLNKCFSRISQHSAVQHQYVNAANVGVRQKGQTGTRVKWHP